MIKASINRLDGFIKDILDYSLNARKDLSFEQIDFYGVIGETQDNFKLINGSERLKVNIRLTGAGPFYSDRTRIGMLMNNLFSNAIKYQDFRKSTSTVSIQIGITQESATLQFSDNGIGIEAHHIPRIFDMFYRASDNSKGSGLGLYIAREAIHKLEGTIHAHSVFGEFTMFEMVIPNQAPKEA